MGWLDDSQLHGLLDTCTELFFYKIDQLFTMLKQLTLFGTVAKVKNVDTVYVQPSNKYEKFVECYFQRNKHTNKAKSVTVRDAQIEWKKTCVKNQALLSDYLKPREGEKPFLSGNCGDVVKDGRILIDFGLNTCSKTLKVMKINHLCYLFHLCQIVQMFSGLSLV